jgi:hypothetical protein
MTFRPPEPRLSLADWRHAEHLFQARREALVPVREPMVLISQIQRSGGTLLNSLLDGHPQLHVHPWEIDVGHPSKSDWPRLDLEFGADAWLATFDQRWLRRAFEVGYRKDRPGDPLADESLPLTIVPSFVEHLFRILVSTDPPASRRAVLDHYFTAFFNAWIDCQGLWDEPKRWVAGFCARLAWGESRARWWSDYPDGRLITVLRDPRGWFASARSYDARYSDLEGALAEWRRGVDEIAAAKRERPDQVFVLTYEQLVREPEPVTRAIAAWLGIDWDPSLLSPTFNRLPVPPDSSFDMPTGGVRTESLDRWRTELEDREIALIEQQAVPVYDAVGRLAGPAA